MRSASPLARAGECLEAGKQRARCPMSKTAVMKLPTIPAPEALVALADIEALESSITKQLVTVDDLDVLQLWRAQAAALATYLHGKQLHLPMLAVQRKIEARIGQVLGEPRNGGDK